MLTAIPFIAEFSLACANGDKPSLYADIDGTLVPVTQGIEGDKYQVWRLIKMLSKIDIIENQHLTTHF